MRLTQDPFDSCLKSKNLFRLPGHKHEKILARRYERRKARQHLHRRGHPEEG
ncbi:hypothetical protein [Methylacidimicrobium cyclopophantes]|uniref:hypothetical protein n=1 Tax=Methylacidimicrobium cyclopophantes TaxID=1041766 RepID=UPI0015B6FA21|nr:hypothetical protein [Methylacidimicrobium cyclopophantes]